MSPRIGTREPRVRIAPYPRSGGSGHFTPQRVWIAGDDDVLQARSAPRDAFAGHVLETPWDLLHELYFAGYAMWNYFNTPFLFTLPGVQSREGEPHEENGETWRRLVVTFPSDIPTHCAEQTFFFDAQGLLRRQDYVTDILGGVASHYSYDHTRFGDLVFPTLRRVVRRTPQGPLMAGPTAVLMQVSDLRVETGEPFFSASTQG